MNAELIKIAELSSQEIDAAVQLLRCDEGFTLEAMEQVASSMACGPAQLALALRELRQLVA